MIRQLFTRNNKKAGHRNRINRSILSKSSNIAFPENVASRIGDNKSATQKSMYILLSTHLFLMQKDITMSFRCISFNAQTE